MNCGAWYTFGMSLYMLALFVIGLFGNTTTILVLWRDRAKSATPLLLIFLALFDNGMISTVFHNRVLYGWCQILTTQYCVWYNKNWAFISAYIWPFGTFFHMTSALSVVMVTFVRFAAVQFPHNSKMLNSARTAIILIVINVIISATVGIPRFFRFDFYFNNQTAKWKSTRRPAANGTDFKIGFEVVYYYLVLYVIPISALVFMSYKIVRALKISQTQSKKQRDDREITRSILGVVFFFLFCQSFNPIRRALEPMLPKMLRACPYFYFYYYDITVSAITLNSSCNFIIYIILVKRFRARFKQLFRMGLNEIEPVTKTGNTTIA